MTYPPGFLDQLRACVRISQVMGRRFQLRKQGGEFVVAANPSLSGNDKKGVWKEFGNGGPEKGGDIFAWLEAYEGLTFPQAVECIAGLAGVPVPDSDRSSPRGNGRADGNGNGSYPGAPAQGTAVRDRGNDGRRVVVGSWDYVGRDGRPIYQTVRVQFRLADGSWRLNPKTGKPDKTFYQRRRSPDVDATWVNSLSFLDDDGEPIEFMRRGPGADWTRYREKEYRDRQYGERCNFAHFGNIAHTLLNLPMVLDELAEERSEQQPVFLPEGEKKVDVLVDWGLVATCNSGGAGNWNAGMTEALSNAANLIILEDNDDAGRKRTLHIAPLLVDAGCRVRVLPMSGLWPDCPHKSDVVDWHARGGTRESLLSAIESLPEWSPPPFESKYGAQRWGAHRDVPIAAYEWQVKGIIPAGHNVLIMGPSGSGKSFETTTLALAVARGVEYNGRKVKRAGVVYLNYEGKAGMAKRLRAYEQHHGALNEFLPFTWLTRPPGLYASEENAVALAKDIKELTADWPIPVGVIVVDTHNAATRGSSEIKTEDVSKIMDRYALVQGETGAAIWIVGHTNASGEHRGNEVLANNIETTILVEKLREGHGRTADFQRDGAGNVLRRVTVRKQREGVDGLTWDFILREIELGVDPDGDVVTSMVPIHLTPGSKVAPRRRAPTVEESYFLQCLREALDDFGVARPAGLRVAQSVTRVVPSEDFISVYDSRAEYDRDNPKDVERHVRVRRNVGRALSTRSLIGIRKLGEVTYMWPVRDTPPVSPPTSPTPPGEDPPNDNSPIF